MLRTRSIAHRWPARTADRCFAVAAGLFAGAYGWIVHRAGIHQITDSDLYRRIATEPFGFGVVFENKRPPLYPLIIRLCGGDLRLVVALQMAAYFGAWVLLGWTLYRPLRDAKRPGRALCLVACVFTAALYPEFAGWNHLVMTESLSLSGLVAELALIARATLNGDRRSLLLAACLLAAGALLRDTSLYLCLGMLLPVAVLTVRRAVPPGAAAGAALVLLAGSLSVQWSSDHVHHNPFAARWVFPMLNVVGQRILPDPVATADFAAHGMPVGPTLLSMRGRFAHEGRIPNQFWIDPELQGFRDWLVADGRSTYAGFLVRHPGFTLRRLWLDRADLFQATNYRLTAYPDTRYGPDALAGRSLYYDTNLPPRIPLLAAYAVGGLGSAALVASGMWRHDRRRLTAGLVTGSLFLLLFPLAVLAEHGDTMETARHAVMIPAQAVVVALLCVFLALLPDPAIRR